MPNFSVEALRDIANRVLTAAGVPEHDADVVSLELSEANAVGHDSHRVMRLVQYIQMIDDGYVKLGTDYFFSDTIQNVHAVIVSGC